MPPPDRDDNAYVYDMLKYGRILARLLNGKDKQDLYRNEQFRFAVERVIEIIGQAAREVSEEYEIAHPDINWKGIVAQRHVLAHEYGDIDLEKIWRVASWHVPKLIELLEPLVPPSPPDPEPESETKPK